MYTQLIFTAVVMASIQLAGCGSDVTASDNIGYGTTIPYEISSGIQTDIFHQKIEVIDNASIYNTFLLSIPSAEGITPTFDENTQTIVAVLSNSKSCIFTPTIAGVFESSVAITVKMFNKKDEYPDGVVCDPLPFDFFAYNLVTISKTTKPISVMLENQH